MSDIELKGHPLALIFPRPSAAAQAELGASIETRGQRELIVLFEGMILDGLTRYTECRKRGIPPKVRLYDPRAVSEGGDGPSPIDFVEDRNLHRRDLTTGQRAAIAAELEELRHGGRRRSAPPGQDANLQLDGIGSARASETRADLAERHGVSERSIADAAKVREQGAPELREALKQGEIVPDVAAVIAEKPMEEQATLIAALPRDEHGKLTPEAKRQVRAVAKELKEELTEIKKQRRAEREREQGQANLALPGEGYGVIVADPEWRFKPYSAETGMDRHAANHYATSALDTIMARRAEVDRAAGKNCVLGLWVTDLPSGLKVLEAWGFEYRSYFVWVKDVVDVEIHPETLHALKFAQGRYLRVVGPPALGFWNRDRDEIMLVGVRGDVACPAQGTQGESVWFAAKPHIESTSTDLHSAKPDICFDWFDRHFPSYRKLEMNARAARDGWDRWGLEAPPATTMKFSPADEDASPDPADDEDGGDLPAFPWSAGIDASDEAEAAAAGETIEPPIAQLGVPAFLREPGDAA